MAVNLIDRAIAWASPVTALRRASARKALAHYDGAELNRRNGHWRRGKTDANGAFAGKLPDLQAVSRDLTRNNPSAARAIEVIVNNTIGTGIIPKVKLVAGGKGKEAEALRISDMLTAISETRDFDADGLHNLAGLQRLALRAVVESGEVLVRRRWRRPGDGFRVPFQLQLIETDYLDTSKDGTTATGTIVGGIEFDMIGRRVAYHIYSYNPNSLTAMRTKGFASSRVDAAEISHVFRADRPGQVRGVPWASPAMVKMKDAAEYEDAQLMRQKIAACFAAFVHNSQEPDLLSEVTPESADRLETLAPGIVEHLTGGQSVTFGSPPDVGGYVDVMRLAERKIAAAYGITYEALSGDYSNVNFSSGRMGWIEMARNVDAWRWNMFIPTFCGDFERWFWEALALSMGSDIRRKYYIEWTAPRREMIDPVKEIKAMKEAVRAGLLTWQEALRQLGYDPARVIAELKEDNAAWDAAGLSLECDPRVEEKQNLAKTISQTQQAKPDDGIAVASLLIKNLQEEPRYDIARDMAAILKEVAEMKREEIHLHMPETKLPEIRMPDIVAQVNVPENQAPIVHVAAPIVNVHVPHEKKKRTITKVMKHDERGRIAEFEQTEIE